MEEIEKLRAKAIASMASTGNPNPKRKRDPIKSKEEGELSSSDDEEEDLPTCYAAPSNKTAFAEPTPTILRKEQSKRLKTGNVLHANSSSITSDMQQRTSTTQYHSKRMKKMPFKSNSPSWHGLSGSSDNLVISFSDDDNESESEEPKSERTTERTVNASKVERSRRPMTTSNRQLEVLPCRPTNQMKSLPAKVSASHPYIPSVAKIQGANFRAVYPLTTSSVKNESQMLRRNSIDKNSSSQELGYFSDVNMADNKLKSLRQQIALRENELKVQKRSIPEVKERITGSHGDYPGPHGMKVDTKAARMDRPIFDDTPNSQETECLKLVEHFHSKVNSDGRLQLAIPSTKPNSEIKSQVLKDSGHLQDQSINESASRETYLGTDKHHKEANLKVSLSSRVIVTGVKDKESLMTSKPQDGVVCQRKMSSPKKVDTSFLNSTSRLNLVAQSSMDRESLPRLEESLDKDLEEAQELRRKCELEEMQALKAYRKAQKALIAANSKCSFLYRRRELLSLWTSRLLSHRETVLDAMEMIPKMNSDLLSELSGLMQAEGLDLDLVGYDFNSLGTDSALPNTSYQHMNGHDFRSEQSCEHDVSASNPKDNGVTLVSQQNMSTDGDQENFPIDNRSAQSRLVSEDEEVNCGEETVDIDVESERKSSVENAQDYEFLEASLRSKLVARLGVKTTSNTNDGGAKVEKTINKGADMAAEINESIPFTQRLPSFSNWHLQEGEKTTGGSEIPGRNICQLPEQTSSVQYCSDKLSSVDASNRNTDREESSSCPVNPAPVLPLPSSVLRVVSRHLKSILPESNISLKEPADVNNCLLDVRDNSKGYDVGSSGMMTIHNSDLAIDPFWPLCMFELRGKCNNEECPWQHLKEKHYRRGPKRVNDEQVDTSSNSGTSNDAHRFPCGISHNILSIPTYRIGSDLIKADMQLSQSVMARSMWQYWQMGFCTSFPLPFSIQRTLPPNAPCLHAGDGPVVDDDGVNRLSLYFQSQDGTVKQLMHGLSDFEQSLELALDLFNGKVNKVYGRRKALSVLSRALETDPNSVVLWVIYLHIYYWQEKIIGKDDMFSHAVQLNKGSYELWLMYINSRMQLGDRMNAYENALSAFCCRTHNPDKESKYTSACILDLFLQMIDFLCMCGDVEKAISTIHGLLYPPTDFKNCGHTLLSNILSHLIISDRCIFWICCTYVAIYRKLPEAIVQQFEFEKDLPFGIEWPATQIPMDEKYRALELMKVAVDTMALDTDGNLHESDSFQETTLRSAHCLAISHVRCVAALDGLECTADLLAKYIKMYPACIELPLISARLQKNCANDVCFGVFEEALCNWPKGIPGIQCLWNQYAEYALDNGRIDFAEKLMVRWFHTFCEVRDSECVKIDGEGNGLCNSFESTSLLIPGAAFHSNKKDGMFGLLNLCLYRLLQKNIVEARLAVDKALSLATSQDFRHCATEHAAFMSSSGSVSLYDSQFRGILGLLNSYLGDVCSFGMLEPLSRRFYGNIKKPKSRRLVDDLLGPVSLDCSSINSVLETLYGPSLLPEKFDKPKNLVDHVEFLMGMMPANYQLVLSGYKIVTRNLTSAGGSSTSTSFWLSSLLTNSIFQACPVAPEWVWLEAANILSCLGLPSVSERFHQQAVSVYPFSIKLWQSYFNLCKMIGNVDAVVEAARKRGFELS